MGETALFFLIAREYRLTDRVLRVRLAAELRTRPVRFAYVSCRIEK